MGVYKHKRLTDDLCTPLKISSCLCGWSVYCSCHSAVLFVQGQDTIIWHLPQCYTCAYREVHASKLRLMNWEKWFQKVSNVRSCSVKPKAWYNSIFTSWVKGQSGWKLVLFMPLHIIDNKVAEQWKCLKLWDPSHEWACEQILLLCDWTQEDSSVLSRNNAADDHDIRSSE